MGYAEAGELIGRRTIQLLLFIGGVCLAKNIFKKKEAKCNTIQNNQNN